MDVNPQGVLADGLQSLNSLITATPLLSLDFYDFGTILRKRTDHGEVSYAVRPAQVIAALSDKVSVESGLLPEGNLFFAQEGVKQIVVEYRKPQKTGIWIEGRENPFRIPMPGLILARVIKSDQPTYRIFAVKRRPPSLDEPLYVSPLPNTYHDGNICWGTVERVRLDQVGHADLRPDWQIMLGAAFNNHAVSGKSKSHSSDIRKLYEVLEASQSKKYPMDELIKANKLTLGGMIEGLKK